MEKFKLFDHVTGLISSNRESWETITKLCDELKVQHRVNEDSLEIRGTLEQLEAVEKEMSKYVLSQLGQSNQMQQYFYILPQMTIYLRQIHGLDLSEIERRCNVLFLWNNNNMAGLLKSQSNDTENDHFKQACHYFSMLLANIADITSLTFPADMSEVLHELTTVIPRIIMIPEGQHCTIWGKPSDIAKVNNYLQQSSKTGSSVQVKQGNNAETSRSIPTQISAETVKPGVVLSYETSGKIKVMVYEGDITTMDTDIIVNASNKCLSHRGGGLAHALVKAAGSLIQDESDNYIKKNGYLATGDVAVTTAGKLNAKILVHVVGPRWKKHREKSPEIIKKICFKIFNIAEAKGYTSIAMPAIGTGVYEVPRDVCAQAIFEFIDEFDVKCKVEDLGPFEFHLVNIDKKTVLVFQTEFEIWKAKQNKPGDHSSSMRNGASEHEDNMVNVNNDVEQLSITNNINEKQSNNIKPMREHEESRKENTTQESNKEHSASYQNHESAKKDAQKDTNEENKSLRSIGAQWPTKNGPQGKQDECPICLSALTKPKFLEKCGHTFCTECIDKAFTTKKSCPICQKVYGVSEGDQPLGNMTVEEVGSNPVYYQITYDIPNGIQDDRHPNPGKPFHGTKRKAYLPKTEKGKKVLDLLRKAFDKKLIFTVGRSTTTGEEDIVTWNDIHHKTSLTGGPDRYGYPDPKYLERVTEELKAKGIVADETTRS